MKKKGVTNVDYLTFYDELHEYITTENEPAQDILSCDESDNA